MRRCGFRGWARDYPRVRGGTILLDLTDVADEGLSPRARGNRP